MGVDIKTVQDRPALKAFVAFPFRLYGGVPQWVPPIVSAEMKHLSGATNPAFEHSKVQLFTAEKDGAMQGRIAAIVNDLETQHIGEVHGRFGWFDCVEDEAVSAALLHAAEEFVRQHGAICLKGPHGFNQLDKTGMLTEGFDTTGTMGTLYNFPYYPKLMEAGGYQKDLEWVEIDLRLSGEIPERFQRYNELAMQRYGLKILIPHNKNELRKTTHFLFDLLMDTYKNLPGFIPISDKQRYAYIRKYVAFMRMDMLVVIADANGEPIGFGLTMPSLTNALKKAGGKLFPFGMLHILWEHRYPSIAELALIGVKEEWRSKGIHGLIFHQTEKVMYRNGIHQIKINPMLEFNNRVLSLWKDYEHRIYKRRCSYRKTF